MIRPLWLAALVLIASSALHAREHTVTPGDTVARIAQRYHVDQNALMHLNHIKDPTELQIGDIIEIPVATGKDSRRTDIIRSGDTLAAIAMKYRVSKDDLRSLNRISPKKLLKIGDLLLIPNGPGDNTPDPADETPDADGAKKGLRPHPPWAGGVKGLVLSGLSVDGGVQQIVQEGQTLAMIARAYRTTEGKLSSANSITRKSPLQVGQVIFVPGAKEPLPVRTSEYRPHKVQFIRLKQTQRMKLQLLTPTGKVNPNSRAALTKLLKYKNMKPRLVELFQVIAERFPGKAIEIISGYRKPKAKKGKRAGSSPHSRGEAVDFRIQGVSNDVLYAFIKEFDSVGAGYYPNSLHVHLDVRKKKYLWTDVSGRGQKAIYVRPGTPGHFDSPPDELGDDMDDSEEEVDTDTPKAAPGTASPPPAE